MEVDGYLAVETQWTAGTMENETVHTKKNTLLSTLSR